MGDVTFEVMQPDGSHATGRLARGDWYTIRCAACGRENGVWIDGPDSPARPTTAGPCVSCRSLATSWEPLGISS